METYIETPVIYADDIAKLRKKYPSYQTRNNPHSRLSAAEKLELLLSSFDAESQLVNRLKDAVEEYTNKRFEVDDFLIYLPKDSRTKPERLTAVTQLNKFLRNNSAQEIYNYVKTAEFQKLAGVGEPKMTFIAGLASIINQFTIGYEKYLLINNEDFLIDTLTDLNLENISVPNLATLFIHYNSKLIADIVIKLYKNKFNNAIIVSELEVTYYFMQQILNDDLISIELLNQIRTTYRKPLVKSCFDDFENLNISQEVDALEVLSDPAKLGKTKITLLRELLVNAEFFKEAYVLDEVAGPYFQALSREATQDELIPLEANFVKNIIDFTHSLLRKGYIQGCVTPNSYTAQLRPMLCQFLNIATPVILAKAEAYEKDMEILDRLNDFSIEKLFVVTALTLLTLKTQKELPNTYGKMLDRELVLQCIAYWYTHYNWQKNLGIGRKEPELLLFLIGIINRPVQEISAEDIQTLKGHCQDSTTEDFKVLLESTDVTKSLKGALLRTKTLGNIQDKDTRLRFSDFVKLLNLNNTSDTAHSAFENPNDMVVAQVNATELPRKLGLFSDKVYTFGVTEVEKFLIQIQKKHAPSLDFFLCEEDVATLREMLKERWNRYLLKYNGNEDKVYELFRKPSRSEKVYIALAEVLSNYYTNVVGEPIYIHQLLMPNAIRFSTALAKPTLAKEIAAILSASEEESSVNDIKVSNLVITSTGYALCINFLIEKYIAEGNFINPYTGNNFTLNELRDICSHPDAQIFLNQAVKNSKMVVSERAIDLLVTFLNEAIFDKGFGGWYTEEQNIVAYEAQDRFIIALLNLSYGENIGLKAEKIPGDYSKTVGDIIAKDKNICITEKGTYLARVVLAYKGDNHGLKCGTLIKKAKNTVDNYNGYGKYQPETRHYRNASNDNSELTEHFLRIYEEKNQTMLPSFKFW